MTPDAVVRPKPSLKGWRQWSLVHICVGKRKFSSRCPAPRSISRSQAGCDEWRQNCWTRLPSRMSLLLRCRDDDSQAVDSDVGAARPDRRGRFTSFRIRTRGRNPHTSLIYAASRRRLRTRAVHVGMGTTRCGHDPGRHWRLGIRALARRLLSQGAATGA